jgi:hypothetical protein
MHAAEKSPAQGQSGKNSIGIWLKHGPARCADNAKPGKDWL